MKLKKRIGGIALIALAAHILLFLFVAIMHYAPSGPGPREPMPNFWVHVQKVDHSWFQMVMLAIDCIAIGIACVNSEE